MPGKHCSHGMDVCSVCSPARIEALETENASLLENLRLKEQLWQSDARRADRAGRHLEAIAVRVEAIVACLEEHPEKPGRYRVIGGRSDEFWEAIAAVVTSQRGDA